jgi:hypothetical protein
VAQRTAAGGTGQSTRAYRSFRTAGLPYLDDRNELDGRPMFKCALDCPIHGLDAARQAIREGRAHRIDPPDEPTKR